MRLLVAVDTYVPARISGALQMHDFCRELVAQGHRPTVVTPMPGLDRAWRRDEVEGVEVLRVRAPRTKDIGLVQRALAECWLPFALKRGLRASDRGAQRWDGVVWYSPTIFLGPLVAAITRRDRCRGYLVLRDLFPDWAVDAGVMRRGLAWRFFKRVERYQYRVADRIGVQTPANVALVQRDAGATPLEVLANWLSDDENTSPRFDLDATPLRGRVVFAYTGNMGVAQGMDGLLDLAVALRDDARAGFLFVGRGSELPRLRERAQREGLDNVLFVDEVAPDVARGMLAASAVGMLALDVAHSTHNIPGKFVSYLRAGLPTLARVNPGNDLQRVIDDEGVGRCVSGDDQARLLQAARELLDSADMRAAQGERARALFARDYSASTAVRQVIRALRQGDAP